MEDKDLLRLAIQAVLGQNKSDVEKAEEIVEMLDKLDSSFWVKE